MSFETPDDRRYLESHEWAHRDGDTVRVGISDFAQDERGDEEFGVVESIKAVSDLYAPVGGEVAAVNEALFDAPELVNDDPYGEGWMLEIELDDESDLDELLSAAEYEDQIA